MTRLRPRRSERPFDWRWAPEPLMAGHAARLELMPTPGPTSTTVGCGAQPCDLIFLGAQSCHAGMPDWSYEIVGTVCDTEPYLAHC